MSTTTVSRRVITIKMKRASKPRAPLPRQSSRDEIVGDRARPFMMHAAAPHAVAPRSWWRQALKPAAISFGVLACAGFAYLLLSAPRETSYPRPAETLSSPSVGSGRVRMAQASSYPGNGAANEPIVLSKRSGLTDESFLATSYIRRKVSLPNISGNCVVKGGGNRDVGACLRQQLEQ